MCMKNHFKHEHIDIFLVYGLSLFLIIILSSIHGISVLQSSKKVLIPEKKIVQSPVLYDTSVFDDIAIEGKAYVVYDIVTEKIIASKNETAVLPLASITKVMTAVSAALHVPKDTKLTILSKNIDGKYDLGLQNKQVWSLSELLKYTLLFSSNDGAETIADTLGGRGAFIRQMNDDALLLGLNLSFTDPAGLDRNGTIGGQGTALDAARLFSIARKNIPEILDVTTRKRQTMRASTGSVSGIPNTNQDIENFSGAEASKTGYTEMAGGNLGVIVDISIGHPVVIVVLGSSREGRFRDMHILYTALSKSVRAK